MATVDHPVDGDTIAIATASGTREVRLIGIDTPETKRPGTPVECGGRRASARMSGMLAAGDRVRLVEDPTQDTVDRYDRLLRYVLHDGRDVGLAQVRAGSAEVYVYGGVPFRRVRRYRAAAHTARLSRAGVWGARCDGDFHSAEHHSAPKPPAPKPPPPKPPAAPAPSTGPAQSPSSPPAAPPSSDSRCDPSYEGACLDPDASDYDCAGGEGDGPEYAQGPIHVVGDDHYQLDSDGDGVACES